MVKSVIKGEPEEARCKVGRSRSNTEINRGKHGREEEHSPFGCENNSKRVQSSKTLLLIRARLLARLLRPRSAGGLNADAGRDWQRAAEEGATDTPRWVPPSMLCCAAARHCRLAPSPPWRRAQRRKVGTPRRRARPARAPPGNGSSARYNRRSRSDRCASGTSRTLCQSVEELDVEF
jgi:hypothetical protein